MTQTTAESVEANAIPVPSTGRVQLALRVSDLDRAIEFYTAMFGVGPAKVRKGYANFAIAAPPLKLVLIEGAGGGELDHLGVEVGSTEEVAAAADRLSRSGLVTLEESETACCYAVQDKVWVAGPDTERWEVYTVLADSETFAQADTPQVTLEKGAIVNDGQCCSDDCCG